MKFLTVQKSFRKDADHSFDVFTHSVVKDFVIKQALSLEKVTWLG